MTVCVAGLFTVFRENNTSYTGAIVASDRMLTEQGGEFESEGALFKIGRLGTRGGLMIAGNLPVHSEIFAAASRKISEGETEDIEEQAEIYGACIRAHNRKRAIQLYLDPLKLDEDSFIRRQKEFDPTVASALIRKLHEYSEDIEAMAVGFSGDNACLFQIDERGIVSRYNDRGFLAIGIGERHAMGYLAFSKYSTFQTFHKALFLVHSAKRHAEVASGVGALTDMVLYAEKGPELIVPDVVKFLDRKYNQRENRRKKADERHIDSLQQKLAKIYQDQRKAEPLVISGDKK